MGDVRSFDKDCKESGENDDSLPGQVQRLPGGCSDR